MLGQWLPQALGRPLTRSAVRRLVMAGAVRVDGRPARRPGAPVRAGARLDAAVDLERVARHDLAGDRPFVLTRLAVLHEDGAVLIVDKPPGLPTHATADPSRPHLVGAVLRWLDRGPMGPPLGVHQRLDRDTSGVVLFAKTAAANAVLARQFEAREVEKTYLALTRRPPRLPPERWHARGRLAIDRAGRVTVSAEGVAAETAFTRVRTLARALLIEAQPLTGRKHQIRAHLAAGGTPILGDPLYGDPATDPVAAPRAMLHAARLRLAHPTTGAPLIVESPLPADMRAVLERAVA